MNCLKTRVISLTVVFSLIFSVFSAQAFALTQPDPVKGNAAILAEPESGTIMFEQNAYDAVDPASTTKVLTAMIVVEAARNGRISLDDKVTATKEIIDNVPSDASRVAKAITDGEEMPVREYLYCILLSSDCVACDILAQYVSGSVSAFVNEMNARAMQLGCKNSYFVNTHGYPTQGHYSCAYDLYIICAQAIKYEEFAEIFGTIKYELPATNVCDVRKLYNTNFTMWDPEKITSIYCKYYYEYITGGKTGSSNKSGCCLVSSAEKDGMTLICVVTGAVIGNPENDQWWNESFTESVRLYKWGFESYQHKTALRKGAILGTVKVKSSETKEVELIAAKDVVITVPVEDNTAIDHDVMIYNDTVKAPVSAGDVLGEVAVKCNGETIENVKLLSARTAEKKSGGGVLAVLIILVLIAAGVMLYVVNSDNPRILKQYKPQSTYKKPQTQNVSSARTYSQERRMYDNSRYPQQRTTQSQVRSGSGYQNGNYPRDSHRR